MKAERYVVGKPDELSTNSRLDGISTPSKMGENGDRAARSATKVHGRDETINIDLSRPR
jgi:hypothetical protein